VRAATATLTSKLKVSVQIDKPVLSPPTCHVEEGVRKEREHEVDFHVTGEAASHYPGKLTPKDGRTLHRRGNGTLIKFRKQRRGSLSCVNKISSDRHRDRGQVPV